MTRQERIEIGEMLVGISQLYGRDLTKMALSMLLDAIDDLPAQAVGSALRSWVRESKANRIPTPAEIIAKVHGEPASREAVGREISSRIVGAISKFGWPSPRAARDYIGEDGWMVVERMGGWVYICEQMGVSLSVQTFQAQARDLISAHVEFADKGVDRTRPPSIDERGKGGLTPIGRLVGGKDPDAE